MEDIKNIIVQDYPSFLVALAAINEKILPLENVSFADGFNLHVKMRGKQWDGTIDYKSAEYIIRLQKSIISLHNSFSDAKIQYNRQAMDNIKISVAVRKGCNEFIANTKDIIMSWPAEYQFYGVLIIGILFFGYKFYKVTKDNHKDELAIKSLTDLNRLSEEHNKEAIEKMSNITEKALEYTQKVCDHNYWLATKMKDDDTMQISDGPQLSKQQALEQFTPAIQIEKELEVNEFIIDGNYEILNLNRSNATAKIVIDGRKKYDFALDRLDEGTRSSLFHEYSKAKGDDGHFPLTALRLSILLKGGVFSGGYVDGMDEKRDGAMTLQEAIQASIESAEAALA